MTTADWRPDGWLDDATLAEVRRQLPIVYVDAVPVRVDESGDVVAVGLLLRMVNGRMSRALVSGRVMYHERIRDAILRHLEKDLGPVALPQVPPHPAAVHRGGVPPDARRDAVPRPPPARGVAGLRGPGRR